MGESHQHTSSCNHGHGSPPGVHVHPVTGNLKVAFVLNATFTIIEFVGGIMTNSMAILADAVHDLGDTLAIGSSLFLESYAQKGRSNTYSFGYKRFSPLGALINGIILLAGSVVIIIETVPRLLTPEPVDAQGMLYLAILGVLMNGAAVWKLRREKDSLNQRTVMLHLMEDALGWVAVLLGSVVLLFTDFYWIDPLLSLGIAGFILWNAFKNLRQVLKIFLQATPDNVNIEAIRQEVLQLGEIADVHDMHVWTLDGNYHVLSAHLVLRESRPVHELTAVRGRVNQLLKQHKIDHITVQFEVAGEVCELQTH
jgi:cobalt-zinc-cadmium efflux system protein